MRENSGRGRCLTSSPALLDISFPPLCYPASFPFISVHKFLIIFLAQVLDLVLSHLERNGVDDDGDNDDGSCHLGTV